MRVALHLLQALQDTVRCRFGLRNVVRAVHSGKAPSHAIRLQDRFSICDRCVGEGTDLDIRWNRVDQLFYTNVEAGGVGIDTGEEAVHAVHSKSRSVACAGVSLIASVLSMPCER